MSTIELLDQLKQLSNADRLAVIEAATKLIRQDLPPAPTEAEERRGRLAAAASEAKDLYEPGGELTEWTSLDSEDFVDEHVSG